MLDAKEHVRRRRSAAPVPSRSICVEQILLQPATCWCGRWHILANMQECKLVTQAMVPHAPHQSNKPQLGIMNSREGIARQIWMAVATEVALEAAAALQTLHVLQCSAWGCHTSKLGRCA